MEGEQRKSEGSVIVDMVANHLSYSTLKQNILKFNIYYLQYWDWKWKYILSVSDIIYWLLFKPTVLLSVGRVGVWDVSFVQNNEKTCN